MNDFAGSLVRAGIGCGEKSRLVILPESGVWRCWCVLWFERKVSRQLGQSAWLSASVQESEVGLDD